VIGDLNKKITAYTGMEFTLNKTPLAGKNILTTRARDQSSEFATRLKRLGAKVIEFPTIEILPPTSWKEVDRAIDQLKSYDWIIFTSANGVKFFFQRLEERAFPLRFPASLKVCAIGPATAKQLKGKGFRVDYTPKEFIAEAILDGFGKMAVQGKRILLARVKQARDVLPKGLKKLGAEVDVVEAYRTVKPRGGTKRLTHLLTDEIIDVITFTSSSTVNHFVELLEKEDMKRLLKGIVIACIGPITAQTAKRWGMKVKIQPNQYTTSALTRAIAEYFNPPFPPLAKGGRGDFKKSPMNQSPIEVILFDLGNVILPFNHYQIAEKLSRFSQKKEFQDPQKIFAYLFDFGKGAVNGYEVGKVSSIQFFKSLKEYLHLSLSFEEFIPIWNDIFTEDQGVSTVIRSLKGNKKLGLISNTNPLHFDYILSKFPITQIFDKWILSHEVGFKKPAIEVFQKAMDWASVKPKKILFIDDIKGHVDVAVSLGMQGIHFTSAQQLKEELRILDVLKNHTPIEK
jgi:uroporphyrinogen-III synthase/FMN phosphatase YigB (HAD superfamily)